MTSTDTRETIRQFLALPPESIPKAAWVDDDFAHDIGDPWPFLIDALRPADKRLLSSIGFDVVLKANRDKWRSGVVVMI